MPYALINVVVNRPIRRFAGSIAEVRRPAPQNLIQPVPHLLPGPRITGYEKVSHLFLDACHCLLRRACPQIPTAILLIAMRPERVTQKVEAFLARLRSFPPVNRRFPFSSRSSTGACSHHGGFFGRYLPT